MIDGASRLGAFLKVITPIMWPGIFSTALFTLLLAYHEFLLVRILHAVQVDTALGKASISAARRCQARLPCRLPQPCPGTIPIVLVILFFQKQLVKGLSAGAVKG